MVTKADYGQREVDACKAVLVELVHLLGEYRDLMVLVGGWVPPLLYPHAANTHVGSLDIDLALNHLKIDEETYQTLKQVLIRRKYREGGQPFIFYRDVPLLDGTSVTVAINFLSGEYGGTGKTHRTQMIQDIRARKARGCDLAFGDYRISEIEAELPEGGRDHVQVRIAGIVPFLVMKGMALADRLKEKDAWDIYFCLKQHPGGVEGLIAEFNSEIGHGLVKEGLLKIAEKFASPNQIGPKHVADFESISDKEERERIQRDAFERVDYFLRKLGVV
jgi:hypothetical protein